MYSSSDFSALVSQSSSSPSLVSLAAAVVSIVAMWKIFVKAGQPGWKSLIPFYNGYILYKIAWKGSMFWLTLGSIFGGAVVGALLMQAVPAVGMLVVLAGIITGIVLAIMSSVRLGRAFGKSGGFIAGLVLVSVVFQCILAFDDSVYIGPQA